MNLVLRNPINGGIVMSIAVIDMIKRLDKEETNQVVDYIQCILSKRKQYSLSEGKVLFDLMREEMKINGLQNMTLDEINDEIRAARKERRSISV